MLCGVQRQRQLCVVLVSCCIQLMVSRVTSLSSSTCDVVRFKWVKSEPDGEVLCATAPSPTVSASIKTKDECSHECAHKVHIGTCAAGFNYRHDQTLCELFANQPTTLQVLPGCEYYTVCQFCKVIYRVALCRASLIRAALSSCCPACTVGSPHQE